MYGISKHVTEEQRNESREESLESRGHKIKRNQQVILGGGGGGGGGIMNEWMNFFSAHRQRLARRS